MPATASTSSPKERWSCSTSMAAGMTRRGYAERLRHAHCRPGDATGANAVDPGALQAHAVGALAAGAPLRSAAPVPARVAPLDHEATAARRRVEQADQAATAAEHHGAEAGLARVGLARGARRDALERHPVVVDAERLAQVRPGHPRGPARADH